MQPCKPDLHQWTPALRARFLDHISTRGDVRAAAAACGLSRQSVYKLRWREPDFAAEWDAALVQRRAAAQQSFMRHLAGHPSLAPVLRRMGVLPGAEFAPLDTVNSINLVSTARVIP